MSDPPGPARRTPARAPRWLAGLLGAVLLDLGLAVQAAGLAGPTAGARAADEAGAPPPFEGWAHSEAGDDRATLGGSRSASPSEDGIRLIGRLRAPPAAGEWRGQIRLAQTPRRGPGWLAGTQQHAPRRVVVGLSGERPLDRAGRTWAGAGLTSERRLSTAPRLGGSLQRQELWLSHEGAGGWLAEVAIGRDRCRRDGAGCFSSRWQELSLSSVAEQGTGAWRLGYTLDTAPDGSAPLARWQISLGLGSLAGGETVLDAELARSAEGRSHALLWRWTLGLDARP